MESYLNKNFQVESKNPSEEAQRRWRSAVSVVKNPRRRFRMVADLAKRAEAEKKKLKIQIPSSRSTKLPLKVPYVCLYQPYPCVLETKGFFTLSWEDMGMSETIEALVLPLKVPSICLYQPYPCVLETKGFFALSWEDMGMSETIEGNTAVLAAFVSN